MINGYETSDSTNNGGAKFSYMKRLLVIMLITITRFSFISPASVSTCISTLSVATVAVLMAMTNVGCLYDNPDIVPDPPGGPGGNLPDPEPEPADDPADDPDDDPEDDDPVNDDPENDDPDDDDPEAPEGGGPEDGPDDEDDNPGCPGADGDCGGTPSAGASCNPVVYYHGMLAESYIDAQLRGPGLDWSHKRTYNSSLMDRYDIEGQEPISVNGSRWGISPGENKLYFHGTGIQGGDIDYILDTSHKWTFDWKVRVHDAPAA